MKLLIPNQVRFEQLVERAQACRACPTMDDRQRVLSAANGPHDARIMLIGEAPGRLGAERTGTPFQGDESGRRLNRLIDAASWQRTELFITNAVLCNPQNERGNNRPPAARELRNCQSWLRAQIESVNPFLVIGLGAVALRALNSIEAHKLHVRCAGAADPVRWNTRWLAAAYHPGARAAIHRATTLQVGDFQRLGEWHRINAGNDAGR